MNSSAGRTRRSSPFGRTSHVFQPRTGHPEVDEALQPQARHALRAWLIRVSDECAQWPPEACDDDERANDKRWRMFLEDDWSYPTLYGPFESLVEVARARCMDELYVYSLQAQDYLRYVRVSPDEDGR